MDLALVTINYQAAFEKLGDLKLVLRVLHLEAVQEMSETE